MGSVLNAPFRGKASHGFWIILRGPREVRPARTSSSDRPPPATPLALHRPPRQRARRISGGERQGRLPVVLLRGRGSPDSRLHGGRTDADCRRLPQSRRENEMARPFPRTTDEWLQETLLAWEDAWATKSFVRVTGTRLTDA